MAALRSFVYVPMADMGEVVGTGPTNTAERHQPDFLTGPYSPPKAAGDYDEFGWSAKASPTPTLTCLEGASVQRQSLGRDRYHIVLRDGVCARDSYHDGEWLALHTGERVAVGLKTPDGDQAVPVNIMDDVPIDGMVEDAAVLLSHFWAPNYAHTLLETVPRLWAFDTFPWLKEIPVIWDTEKPWQKEIANIVGFERVAKLPANRTQFRKLFVPSFFSQIGSSPQSIGWLCSRFGAPLEPGRRRIFVSRADALERRVINENAVIDLLKPMGFETVMLTGMSVVEQMRLFGEAECVVMPHGAGCANMIFAGTGTKIVEFVPKSYQHHMFWHIAKWSGHWYGRIVCEDGANKDMHVDLSALRRALDAAGL